MPLFVNTGDKIEVDTRDGSYVKHYEYPFRADARTIVKIGVNFSTATRNLTAWLIDR